MTERGQNAIARAEDPRKLDLGPGLHKKMTVTTTGRVGLGNNNKHKQLTLETGMLQGGAHRARHHPLLPVRHHITLGTAGRQDEPEPRTSAEGMGVDTNNFNSNTLNAFVRGNESRINAGSGSHPVNLDSVREPLPECS